MKLEVVPNPTSIDIFGDTYQADETGAFHVRNRKGEFDRWVNLLPLDARRLRVRSRTSDTVIVEPAPTVTNSIGLDGSEYFARNGVIEVPDEIAVKHFDAIASHGLRPVITA